MNAYITKFGTPILINNDFSDFWHNTNGFLEAFEYKGIVYIFQTGDFLKNNKQKFKIGGYYKHEEYDNYLSSTNYSFEKLNRYKFPLEKFKPSSNYIVIIPALQFDEPSIYFREGITSFYEEDPNKNFINKDGEIKIPETATTKIKNKNRNSTSLGRFYTKNFGQYIEGWNLDSDQEKNYTKTVTFTCTLIEAIMELVLTDLFPIPNASVKFNELDNLFDKLLYKIYDSWGFISENFSPIIPNIENFKSTPVPFEAYENYYSFVIFLYKSLIKLKGRIEQKHKNDLLISFLVLIPENVLGFLKYEDVIFLLNELIKNKHKDNRELKRAIPKLISNIQPEKADNFLEYLLNKNNSVKSNFEILYQLVWDEKKSRIPFLGSVINEITLTFYGIWSNRKRFIYQIYTFWKISKYNFYHIPDDIVANEDGINPNCYFKGKEEQLKYYYKEVDGKQILIETIFEFRVLKEVSGYGALNRREVFYKPDIKKGFQNEKITIIKIIQQTVSAVEVHDVRQKESEYGTYHLFQPISLIGYTPEKELKLNQTSYIPAFLFYYTAEFKEMKDIDALLAFGGEVILEVGLFFALGGMGTLRHLRHLKHITKINQVRKSLLTGNEVILFWRGLEVGAEVVSVTSSILVSYFDYIDTINNDDEVVKKLKYFFLMLTLVSGGKAIFSRYKTIQAADDVLGAIALNGITDVPDDVLKILQDVRRSGLQALEPLWLKIRELDLGTTNKLIAKIEAFTEAEKFDFHRDFGKIDDINIWKKLNEDEGIRMDIYREIDDSLRELKGNMEAIDNFKWLVYDNNGINWQHIDNIFIHDRKMIAGHNIKYFENLSNIIDVANFPKNKFIYILDVPPGSKNIVPSELILDINGHLVYDNLYYITENLPVLGRPGDKIITIGGIEMQVKKYKFQKTVWNPNWTDAKKKSEMVFALQRKSLIKYLEKSVDYRTDTQIVSEYISEFSDGTKIKISLYNFHKFAGSLVTDFSYFEILK